MTALAHGPGFGLGLDGGGSATRWAVADARGEIVASGELPPVTGHLYHAAEQEVFATMAGALARDVAPMRVASIVAGITGLSAGRPSAHHAASVPAAALDVPPANVHVEDDIWIAFHAAFRPGRGHLVYAGTGSIGMHIRADGTALRVGGRGMLIDDAGSAFWIGRVAIDRLFRRIDATGEATGALADAVFGALGGHDWDTVRTHVYGGGRTQVALLARDVARAAEAGDADALGILREAGTELARLANTLAARIGNLPVALSGRASMLHPAILGAMRDAAPGLAIEPGATDAAAAAARIAVRTPA